MRTRNVLIGWFVFLMASQLIAASNINSLKLVRVYLKEKGSRPVVGELLEEDDKHIVIFDFIEAKNREFKFDEVQRVGRDVSEQSAAVAVDISRIIARKIQKALPLGPISGKVAKIDQGIVYINIGSKDRLQPGNELFVYRGSEDVRDPDTKAVLDRVRRKVGKLKALEVRDSVSKCEHVGEYEGHYQVGDEVQSTEKVSIAVLPFLDSSGNRTTAGDTFAEQLTNGLVAVGISVVERTRLSDALTELGIQQSNLFSKDSSQKIGKQIGATALVLGSLTDKGKSLSANIRLTRVESGEILLSASHTLAIDKLGNTSAAAPIASSPENMINDSWYGKANKHGTWELANGKWVFTRTPGGGMVDIPQPLPSKFKMTLKARPSNVGTSTCIALYFKSGIDMVVQLAADGSCVIAEGKDPRSDHTAKYGQVFKDNTSNTIVYDVRDGRLAVSVNGQQVLFLRNPRIGNGTSDQFSIGALGEWTFEFLQIDGQ